jgi:hypothetical protein
MEFWEETLANCPDEMTYEDLADAVGVSVSEANEYAGELPDPWPGTYSKLDLLVLLADDTMIPEYEESDS